MTDALAAARASGQVAPDYTVAAGGLDPRLGCCLIAHEKLGYCWHCPGITGRAEALAWRLWASGHGAPALDTVRAWSVPR